MIIPNRTLALLALLVLLGGGCGPAAVDPAEIPTADPISGVNPLVAEGLEAAILWITR